jgi:hypothetical protein
MTKILNHLTLNCSPQFLSDKPMAWKGLSLCTRSPYSGGEGWKENIFWFSICLSSHCQLHAIRAVCGTHESGQKYLLLTYLCHHFIWHNMATYTAVVVFVLPCWPLWDVYSTKYPSLPYAQTPWKMTSLLNLIWKMRVLLDGSENSGNTTAASDGLPFFFLTFHVLLSIYSDKIR